MGWPAGDSLHGEDTVGAQKACLEAGFDLSQISPLERHLHLNINTEMQAERMHISRVDKLLRLPLNHQLGTKTKQLPARDCRKPQGLVWIFEAPQTSFVCDLGHAYGSSHRPQGWRKWYRTGCSCLD